MDDSRPKNEDFDGISQSLNQKTNSDICVSEKRLSKITVSLIFFTCLSVWLSQNLLEISKTGLNSPVFYLAAFNSIIISFGIILAFSKISLINSHFRRVNNYGHFLDESSYRSIIEKSSEAFFIIRKCCQNIDKSGYLILESNFSGNRLVKRGGDIIGRSISELFPSKLFDMLDPRLHISSAYERFQEFEFESDGSDKFEKGWYRFSLIPQGGCIAISVRDITDRKKAEATLKESEEMFRALAETSASLIFIIKKGRYIYTNRAFHHVTGYSEAELSGMHTKGIIHPEDSSRFDKYFAPNLSEVPDKKEFAIPFRERIKILTIEGSEKWVDVSLVPIDFDSSIAVLGTALDITKAKLSEEELKESEVRFRTIFDFFPYAISLSEIESGRFISANKEFCRLTKFQSDEVIGKTSSELGIYPREFRDEFFVPRLKDVGFVNNLETDFRASDGTLFNGSLFSKVIRIRSNDLLISVIKDISDLKNLQRQLQQTQKMEAIGTLAGGIAHDFNNILVPIIAYAEMSLAHFDENDKLHPYISSILKASHRAKELVQQILTFSRHNEMTFEPILLQPVIRETVKFLRASIPSTIDIRTNINKECGAIIGSPSQIHQIIMNLATNAKHAMEKDGGILEIYLEEKEIWPNDFNEMMDIYPGRYARLSISDTGHGIDPSVMDKIFEPYFTTKRDGKGTGIGLSVVHGIVKTYGGSIKVNSRPGKGTRFEIYLPLVHRVSVPEKEQSCLNGVGGKEHILLVDDEAMVVNAEKEMLEALGYRVTAMTNSLDAYDYFVSNNNCIDIVITDMTMPRMTGAELSIKILDIKPDIPIILCTGYSENFTEANASAIGIKKYVAKPFILNRLAVSLREVLEN